MAKRSQPGKERGQTSIADKNKRYMKILIQEEREAQHSKEGRNAGQTGARSPRALEATTGFWTVPKAWADVRGS